MRMKVIEHMLCMSMLFAATAALAQQTAGSAEFDSTVHDFGNVILGSGPLECSFSVKNTGDKPIAIYSVITTCGCTDVSWTKEPIKSGASGQIKVSYANDEGPYPFDKNITVYLSTSKKPVTLKIRGVCQEKSLSLEDSFPVKIGSSLAVKEVSVSGGEVEQGRSRSGSIQVANLSKDAVELGIGNLSEGISVKGGGKMKKRSRTTLEWTVDSDRSRWGKNEYGFDLFADGKKAGHISVNVSTKENFSSMTKSEKESAPRPMFGSSSYTFNRVKAGTKINASFTMSNSGKSTLKIYKVDSDNPKLSCGAIPELAPGAKSEIKMTLDTTGMPSGEVLVIVSLTTNSPLRPVVNLFVTGWIE